MDRCEGKKGCGRWVYGLARRTMVNPSRDHCTGNLNQTKDCRHAAYRFRSLKCVIMLEPEATQPHPVRLLTYTVTIKKQTWRVVSDVLSGLLHVNPMNT